MLRWVFCNLTLSIIYCEQIPPRVKLIVNFAQPRGRLRSLKLNNTVVVRTTVPRLRQMGLHTFRPLLKRYVPNQSGNRHPCPHRTAMNVGLTPIVCFTPRKNDLETKTPIRNSRDSHCQRMHILSMIILVPISELFPHPAFKIRNVARQVHQHIFPRVLPRWAMPSARLEAEPPEAIFLTLPPFFIPSRPS